MQLEQIRDAGIIGMGGAGFPTYTKLKGEFSHIIVNAVECEPLLRSDRYVLIHRSQELVEALENLLDLSGAKTATIALKDSYHKEKASLAQAVEGSRVKMKEVESYYPAGDEQSLVYDVLGEIVPPMQIPLSVDAVVLNASTLLAINEAFSGKPLTHRHITVCGAVKNPCVQYVPVGASFAECIEAAGGIVGDLEDMCIVSGGPMMGKRYADEDPANVFVEKTTSGVLVLPKDKYRSYPLELDRIRQLAKTACIQCVLCTDLCPRHMLGHPLEPHKIMRMLAYNELEDVIEHPVIKSAMLCCECGICELYACPMNLEPRDVNALIKGELRKRGIRYSAPDKVSVHPMREYRKVATKRAASRAGVGTYYDWDFDKLVYVESKRVNLFLSQNIGAPAIPEVSVGDIVNAGDIVARQPEDKLGANLHSPIGGRVASVNEKYIVIER